MSRAGSRINELSGSIFHNEWDSKLKKARTRLGSLLKGKSSARLGSCKHLARLGSTRELMSRLTSRLIFLLINFYKFCNNPLLKGLSYQSHNMKMGFGWNFKFQKNFIFQMFFPNFNFFFKF